MDRAIPGFDRLSVLIIDPNPYARRVLSAVLLGLGVRDIAEVGDGPAGLDALTHRAFSAVFVDYRMPGMDGPTFARALRRSREGAMRATPAIMLISEPRAYDVETAQEAGVEGVVMKPIISGAVRAHLEDIIFRPRAFIETEGYVGPAPRVKEKPQPQPPPPPSHVNTIGRREALAKALSNDLDIAKRLAAHKGGVDTLALDLLQRRARLSAEQLALVGDSALAEAAHRVAAAIATIALEEPLAPPPQAPAGLAFAMSAR